MVEICDHGALVDSEEARIGAEEAPHVGGGQEVELVGLHAHQVVRSYSGLFGRPLYADPPPSPGIPEPSADRNGFSHRASFTDRALPFLQSTIIWAGCKATPE